MTDIILRAMVVLYVLNIILSIYMIGRPRKPWSSSDAIVTFVFNSVFILALLDKLS